MISNGFYFSSKIEKNKGDRDFKHMGILVSRSNICDPPYDFDAKGDSTLTTHLHFTTKEIDFSTLNVWPGAHFISKFFCFIEHT